MRMTPEAAVVTARGLGKTFREGRVTEAVADLDFELSAGEFVSIIGPSGCGKSTLLRLIGGLLTPDRGTITVAGGTPEDGRRAKRFGLVPQTPALVPWHSVRDNLTLLPKLNRGQGRGPVSAAEVDELLNAVGLAPFADALPAQLSGGMQHRISLARAFALRAPILLMDEPFAALDEITRAQMRYLLLDVWKDTEATVVFVTHSIEEAVLLSDRVLVLTSRPGRLSADISIDLDRPRRAGIEDSAAFHRHAAELRAALNAATAQEEL
ncbi:MAG: ABC transporter ATP-binding protein [Acidimicrobiales bacterium]